MTSINAPHVDMYLVNKYIFHHELQEVLKKDYSQYKIIPEAIFLNNISKVFVKWEVDTPSNIYQYVSKYRKELDSNKTIAELSDIFYQLLKENGAYVSNASLVDQAIAKSTIQYFQEHPK